MLGDPAVGDFDVTVLDNAGVLAAGRHIKRFFADAGPDDILLLHIAGHGLRNDEGALYFAVADTVPDLLFVTALAAKDITHEMDLSPARRIVVLLDCCYAGAFDDRKDLEHAGPPVQQAPTLPVGSAGPRDDAHVRGQVIIAAATSIEQAVEGRTGGLFTRCVVHGLRTGEADLNGDGEVDAHELHLYVDSRMSRLGAGRGQRPTYSVHRLQGMLRIAHRAGQSRPVPVVAETPPEEPEPRRPWVRVLLGLVALILSGCGVQGDSALAGDGCPAPTYLRVAVDPAGLGAYRKLATAFENWVAGRRGGCRSADLYVFPVSRADMTAGLEFQWGQGTRGRWFPRDVGPTPDVWLPAAQADVPAFLHDVHEIGYTPIVLGVPRKTGLPEGEREDKLLWPELFDLAAGPAGVVRADPAVSAVARMATTALYDEGNAGAGTARTRFEQPLDRALDAGAYPEGDETALLCRQAQAHGRNAIILTEQMLVRYNLGAACPGTGIPQGGDRLQGFYPRDTPLVHQVVATLRWPREVQPQTTAEFAQWFVGWLGSRAGKQALIGTGLRTDGYEGTEPISTANGAGQWPFGEARGDEPDAAVQAAVDGIRAQATRPGHFLVALDASGSMDDITADPTVTRWEAAVAAVGQTVGKLGERDLFGVVPFAGSAPGKMPTLGKPSVAAVSTATSHVRPDGGTPLYDTIRAGAEQLRRSPGGSRPQRTLIVLTDGKDNTGRGVPTRAQLTGVRVFVIAVGDVACSARDLSTLVRDTGGRCFDAGAGDGLTGLFDAIWE